LENSPIQGHVTKLLSHMTRHKYAFVFVLALYLFTSVGLQIQPIKAAGFKSNASVASVSISAADEEEILWLARLVYSETKRPDEQVLVAWVVRNRVETQYRGKSYKEVALHDSQFSGLNSFDRNYRHNITRNYGDSGDSWKNAVSVANAVYYADEVLRPFPKTVKHFYSPISVKSKPSWAKGTEPIQVIKDTDNSVRFAFYDKVR
jgi:spore germination cell wall hydrolase CwlJ-like protein